MTTSPVSSSPIVSALDLSCHMVFENQVAIGCFCLNGDPLRSGKQQKKLVVEHDCACTDGRSQSIILIPPKDQEPPNRDSK